MPRKDSRNRFAKELQGGRALPGLLHRAGLRDARRRRHHDRRTTVHHHRRPARRAGGQGRGRPST
ncbi:MAG: hypothetical protein MZV49_04930 [Rhodopseudomonas palustris]|nr:hypothetical protein [Rhodopseudomonas palustris]